MKNENKEKNISHQLFNILIELDFFLKHRICLIFRKTNKKITINCFLFRHFTINLGKML